MDHAMWEAVLELQDEERMYLLQLERRHLREVNDLFDLASSEFHRCYRLTKELTLRLI